MTAPVETLAAAPASAADRRAAAPLRTATRVSSAPRGPGRFVAWSVAIHGAVFLAAMALVQAGPRREPPPVVESRFEVPVEVAPDDEPLPDDIPVPPSDDDDPPPESADEDVPLIEADAAPTTISVTDVRSGGFARTPPAKLRRHAAPAGTGVAPPPSPPPPPPAAIAPPEEPSPPPPPRVVSPAKLVRATRPEYPEDARTAGIEGVVVLEIDLDAAGEVAAVRVLESSGSDLLDRAAERCVRRWKFEPARDGDVGVATTVRIPPIRFRIER